MKHVSRLHKKLKRALMHGTITLICISLTSSHLAKPLQLSDSHPVDPEA
jgi:hypothetical protein